MTTTEGLQQIVLILSVANVIIPLVFGFLMWKMSQYFVSKHELENVFKRLELIEDRITDLLQRTADKR